MLSAYLLWRVHTFDPLDPSTSSGVGASVWSTADPTILTLEQDLRRGRSDASTYARLGYAYLQQARETADGNSNDRAERAFKRALDMNGGDVDAMNGLAMVGLTRHHFMKALEWGRRSLEVNPHKAFTYGILVDSYIELGRYDEAVETAQKMVDMRPDLSSYSRVSYIRELMGDTQAAIEAMRWAVSAGSGYLEHTNWCRVYLGHLFFNSGDLLSAEREYTMALQQLPHYGHAFAGLARVRLAQGQHDDAVALYEEAASMLAIPEYVIALGAAYETAGEHEKARTQFRSARAQLESELRSGMDVAEELAQLLLTIDPDAERALTLASEAYDRRPTVRNADILAWAHYKAGDYFEALRLARQALRLGTREAAWYYHAGVIAAAAGEGEEGARYLRETLEINPYFSPRDAPDARARLAALSSGR